MLKVALPDRDIGVRFDPSGEAELNAADLRDSGSPDLARLALVDEREVSSLWVKGDANGWVSPFEVEVAGLHNSIREAYQVLLNAARVQKAPLLRVHEMRSLLSDAIP